MYSYETNKKKMKQVESSNQQKSTAPSSQLDDSSTHVSDDELTGTQTLLRGPTTQLTNVAKRRLQSQSQDTSNKRTRK